MRGYMQTAAQKLLLESEGTNCPTFRSEHRLQVYGNLSVSVSSQTQKVKNGKLYL